MALGIGSDYIFVAMIRYYPNALARSDYSTFETVPPMVNVVTMPGIRQILILSWQVFMILYPTLSMLERTDVEVHQKNQVFSPD
jgi:hypothetical protein